MSLEEIYTHMAVPEDDTSKSIFIDSISSNIIPTGFFPKQKSLDVACFNNFVVLV